MLDLIPSSLQPAFVLIVGNNNMSIFYCLIDGGDVCVTKENDGYWIDSIRPHWIFLMIASSRSFCTCRQWNYQGLPIVMAGPHKRLWFSWCCGAHFTEVRETQNVRQCRRIFAYRLGACRNCCTSTMIAKFRMEIDQASRSQTGNQGC